LLIWFRTTNRDLPWRRTYNPYHVWISEIMLQQTQMDRGVAYFLRWIERFPDVQSVAGTGEQEILKYWEGLGYYARARNLLKTAKIIVRDFGGVVPCEYQQLLTLPGIGAYTAAAIASVAGNHDVPVLDANVSRVYARLFDIGTPVKERQTQQKLIDIARTLLPTGQARIYNQALMDLGGLVCTPKSPHCIACPVAGACRAKQAGTVAERPVAGRKRTLVTMHRMVGLIQWKGRLFIQQRKADDLWGGLWEFPGGQVQRGEGGEKLRELIFAETGLDVVPVKSLCLVRHQYTHHKINLHCFLCLLKGEKTVPILRSACSSRWVRADQLHQFAFPAGPRKVLEYIRQKEPELFFIRT